MIGLSYLSLLLLGWLDNGRSPFFPDIIHDLKLNAIQGSLFFAVTSLVAYLTGFFNDRILRKMSSLEILQWSSVVMGVGYVLISIAPNFPLLLCGSAVFGLGYGVLTFIQNVIIQEWAPPAWRRRIFVGLHSMFGMAALLAPLSASAFIDFGWNWRHAFFFLSTLPVILAFASWKWFRPPAAKDHTRDVIVTASDLSRLALWGAALSVAFHMFGEIGIETRLVLLLRSVYGESPERANMYLAIFFVLYLTARLVFALLDFRHLSNKWVMMTSASASAVILTLSLATHHPHWMIFSGFSMAPFYPVGMNFLAESFGPRHAARALSFGIALCSLTTVILHFTLGVLTDFLGLEQALWLAPAGLLLCVVFLSQVDNSPAAH